MARQKTSIISSADEDECPATFETVCFGSFKIQTVKM